MNLGQQALRVVVQKTPEREIARRCKVTQQGVSLWLTGQRRPWFAQRVALEIQFNIDLHAWDREVPIAADAVGSSSGAEQQRRTG